MSQPNQIHNADAWKDSARSYAENFEQFTSAYGIQALEKLRLGKGERFLDVATGPGAVALHAARTGAEVHAIDFSEGMIALLMERIAAEGSSVRAQVMNGQALEFADGEFDVALSCFGVFLFPDHAQGLREMRRVLKPGGRAAIVVWGPADRMSIRPWQEIFRRESPGVTELERPSGWVAMDSPVLMTAELEAAGFTGVEVEPVVRAFQVPSAEFFVAEGAKNPFMVQAFQKYAPGREQEICGKLRDMLEAAHGTGSFELECEALIGTARVPA
jgi:SAM-dependent methyltransferase